MSGVPGLIILVVGVVLLLIVFGFLARYLRLWLQSYASSAGIGLFDLDQTNQCRHLKHRIATTDEGSERGTQKR